MRRRITPSMVVSLAALVFSTTGSAFAAKTLIDGADIKNGSITSADIKDGSLSSADIKDGSLSGRDIAEGSIDLDRLSDGTEPQTGATTPREPEERVDRGTDRRAKRKHSAAHVVRSLVTFAPGESTARGDEWRAYEGNLGTAPAIDDEGIAFGPFTKGDEWHSAYTYALKGARLGDVARLAYSAKYSGGGSGAAPYVLLVTAAGNRVIFTPSTQPGVTPEANAWQRWVVTDGTVRYDDGTDLTWAELLARHGDETIDYVSIQAGNAGAMSAGSTSHVRDVAFEVMGAAPAFGRYTFRA